MGESPAEFFYGIALRKISLRHVTRRITVQSIKSSSVNSVTSPGDLHKLFEQGVNSGDLDGLVSLYASDGFLMARTGPAQGIGAIRKALAEYVAMKPTIQLTTRKVVQAGDTALLMADWQFHGTARDGGTVSTAGTSIEVARRQSDGSWRYFIDLPNGLG